MRVSVECLFGHLCHGSTFAHDEEMAMLASQQETLKSRTDNRDSQTMTSPREGSVDQRLTSPASPVSPVGSTSDPESHALDDLERMPKRPRISPSFLGNRRGDLETKSPPTEELSPKRKLPELKQSFKSYLRQSKKEKALLTPKSTDPTSNHDGGYMGTSRTSIFDQQDPSAAPHLGNDPQANTLQNERLANRPVNVHHGTRADPIELSEGDPCSQDNQAGDFLLAQMPDPDDILTAFDESQVGPETQVTLSDAAFLGSQSSHNSNPDIKAMKLQQRKEAYKAAKEPSGIWELDHGLISSSAHHGEEELEL